MQISTSAPPTLTAVTPMQSVTIPWDRTHAHVKQGTQEMEGHALVSCKKCNEYNYVSLFLLGDRIRLVTVPYFSECQST